jgi:threonine dehydrogenase-like Zn-dependent dehydrogenase
MRAAIFNGPRSIEVGDRPDPAVKAPTDAVVRVVLGCVCGSDLWYYRGVSRMSRTPSVTSSSAWSSARQSWLLTWRRFCSSC